MSYGGVGMTVRAKKKKKTQGTERNNLSGGGDEASKGHTYRDLWGLGVLQCTNLRCRGAVELWVM